jgi:hypothetical protein
MHAGVRIFHGAAPRLINDVGHGHHFGHFYLIERPPQESFPGPESCLSECEFLPGREKILGAAER